MMQNLNENSKCVQSYCKCIILGLANGIYYASGLPPFHTAYNNAQKLGETCERFKELFAIRNRWSGKVLEYHKFKMKAKTKHGKLNQLWYLSDNSDGYYNIRSVKDPKAN